VRRLLSPWRLAAGLVGLALIAFLVLWLVPSGDYVLLPDRARPVAPLVHVQGARPARPDGIYFVDVIQRRASLLESLFPQIHEGATLLSGSQVSPPGLSERARRRVDLRQMARSQEIAAAVALRALGYRVQVRQDGALIVAVAPQAPAAKALFPSEVIVGVDGRRVRSPTDLRRLIQRHRPGDEVLLALRDDGGRRHVRVRTIADPGDPDRALIGVIVQPAARIRLPIRVRIDSGDIGGLSAGLAFALAVLEKLGRDVDHGRRVAATGQLELDGSVEAVGAIKQKVLGVRKAGIDTFLVPAANAGEARRYAGPLRVIPVRSFQQALRALAQAARR
jgi:PDZ domain-containing protein